MNDLKLLSQYASRKNPNAFRELVMRYHPFVYSVCRRQLASATDADDATQEVFLKLAQNCSAIEKTVGGWLHRCAMNVCNSMLRASKSRRSRERIAGAAKSSDEDNQHWREVKEELDQCLAELPVDDLELIVHYYFRGQTQEKIAAELGTTRQAIQVKLSSIVDRLRANLERRGVVVPAAVLTTLLTSKAIEASVPVASRAAVMKIGLSAVSHTTTQSACGFSLATALGLSVVAVITVAIGFLSLSANGNSHQIGGDVPMGGLIARAPAVGEWAVFSGSGSKTRIDRNGKPSGTEKFGGVTIRVSVVGEAVEAGKPCRWIEIKREEPRRKVIQKVLIPMAQLNSTGHPLEHVVRGWRKVENGEPRKLEQQELKSRLFLYLPGELADVKRLGTQTIDQKLGPVECSGWSGSMKFEESTHKFNATFETWTHDNVPFGVVSSRADVEIDQGVRGKEFAILKMELIDHGDGAMSELPENN